MNIKPSDKTINSLLISCRQFRIPRFQRDYSWEKKNNKEFIDDMINCLEIQDGKIIPQSYFLGTMLFIGDYEDGTNNIILVVDGQQRITTITILFSVLAKIFFSINEKVLGTQIFKYIMTENANGEEVKILISDSHNPFFADFIQDINRPNNFPASSDEEINIRDTYNFFYNMLNEEQIRKLLQTKFTSKQLELIPYVEILKALRDQVLQTKFISISTTDRKEANKIFEILNAKGKSLAHIDLIKNKLFEILDKTEPNDFADLKWKSIKGILSSGNDTIGLATFYRHFWISKYHKCSSNKLYDDFNQLISKDKIAYENFLKDMEINAENYIKIINPQRKDYDNKKQYFSLVESLKALMDTFDIVQVRIALLALFEIKDKSIINLTILKNIVLYLENFHFAYNAIARKPSNRLETIYSNFAINLRKCSTKDDAVILIKKELTNKLDPLFPNFNEFQGEYIKLSFSKKNNSNNLKAKYSITKLHCFFQNEELFPNSGSVEHIVSESKYSEATNIGNLILLERTLNDEAGDNQYINKKSIYKKSSYKWIQTFLEENETWTKDKFEQRAKKLAEIHYTKILGRKIIKEDSVE